MVIADVLVAFSLDVVGIVAGYAHHDIDNLAVFGHYGSCFDCMGWSGVHYFVSKSKRTAEMQPGEPYCDECLKRWINEGRLFNIRSSPICSECKQSPKSLEDKRDAMHINLHHFTDDPSTTSQVYTNGRELHGIDAKDIELYRQHARNNYECGLSTKLWLCSDCFKLKPKPPIMDVACDMCKSLFQRCYTTKTHTKHCCWSLGLERCYMNAGCYGDREATRWKGSLYLSDAITLGEARELCYHAVCDDCIGKLVEQGKVSHYPPRDPVDA